MRLILLLLLAGNSIFCSAQKDSTPIAPFLKTRKLPSFKILLTDSSTYFYKSQLKENTPTVIIFFNPDCDHCIKETKNLLDSMNLVQEAQFVFASYGAFNGIKKYDSLFKLSSYPNIKIGRDVNFILPSFYKIRFTPFMAVYDNKGALLRAYEGGTTIKKLAVIIKS